MRVLIVEDEQNISLIISRGLKANGMETEWAFDGETALALIEEQDFDVIVLDVILPKINGWELCRRLREDLQCHTPILMLSALGTTQHVVKGLDAGADDYLSKPFKVDELAARIRALHRRKQAYATPSSQLLEAGGLRMNVSSMEVWREGYAVPLTAREFALLKCFLERPGTVLSREQLLEAVWGIDFDTGTNIVDVYVNYLRRKTEIHGLPRLIVTKVGAGYLLKVQDED